MSGKDTRQFSNYIDRMKLMLTLALVCVKYRLLPGKVFAFQGVSRSCGYASRVLAWSNSCRHCLTVRASDIWPNSRIPGSNSAMARKMPSTGTDEHT